MFVSLDQLLQKDAIYCDMIICTWALLLWPDVFVCLFVCVWEVGIGGVFLWVFVGFVLVFFCGGNNTNLALHVTGSRWIGEEGEFLFYNMRKGLGIVTLEGINTWKPYIF